MDEVAAALSVDPIEFRLRHVKDPRDIAVIKAAAEKSGWDTRGRRRARTRPATRSPAAASPMRNATAPASP